MPNPVTSISSVIKMNASAGFLFGFMGINTNFYCPDVPGNFSRSLSVVPKEPMNRRRRATKESSAQWQKVTFYKLLGDSSHRFFAAQKKSPLRMTF